MSGALKEGYVSESVPEIEEVGTMQLLARYKQTGDEQLKWAIVLRYEHIVKCVAMQVRGIYSGFAQVEDIINEGLLTLLKAVDKFDPEKGVKFETYVSKRIRGMVVDLARKQDWMPRNVRKKAKDIDEATNILANELGRYPTAAEVAAYLNIPEDKYQRDLACVAMNNVISLEALMDTGEMENNRFEIPSHDSSVMPNDMLESKELKDVLTQAVSSLQENEQIVLSLYYVENLLLKDIAHVMNVSEPRVSQLHTRAIGKLRKIMASYYGIAEPSVKREKKV